MAYSLIWLPSVLREAGLKVALVPGWEERGRGDVRTIHGVICHHTATPERHANMPTLDTLIHGRKNDHGQIELAGPLAQLGLGRDGTYYVLAAGRCNHAGAGIWQGLTNGNANFIGIEAENTGGARDFPWPAHQMEAYHHGVAAILRHVGKGVQFCAAHKEYARPLGRKSDPVFEMGSFRASVAAILAGTVPAPAPIPATEPGAAARPTLRRGARNNWVNVLQTGIGVAADGAFGGQTEAALRAFQRAHGLLADGIAGPQTWLAIDKANS